MTVMGAINQLNAVKPNNYGQTEKIKWLSTLDGMIKAEIIDTHEGAEDVSLPEYSESSLMQELLVGAPHDDIYIKWLEAQIDYANGEYGRYNNTMTMFNAAYDAYARYYNRTHMPLQKSFTHF
ncbi:MAG: hypothetical protein J6V42_06285 [Clostridia bacterium]|nr:hypothetical protein [Clostridia bacterium]